MHVQTWHEMFATSVVPIKWCVTFGMLLQPGVWQRFESISSNRSREQMKRFSSTILSSSFKAYFSSPLLNFGCGPNPKLVFFPESVSPKSSSESDCSNCCSSTVCTVMQQVNPINFQAINAMSSRQLHIPVEYYNLRHDYCATVKTLVKCTYSFGTYNDISLFLNTRKGLVCSDVYLYTYICHSNLIDE